MLVNLYNSMRCRLTRARPGSSAILRVREEWKPARSLPSSFFITALDLMISCVGEDVVAEDVRSSVVLVKAAVGSAINDIAGGENAGTNGG